jgi:drug/metabolite transporter (DMT)-like permease
LAADLALPEASGASGLDDLNGPGRKLEATPTGGSGGPPREEHPPARVLFAGFLAAGLLTTVAGLALYLAYGRFQAHIEHACGLGVTHVCCMCFVVLSVSIDLSIKAAAAGNGGSYSFEPAAAVFVVETCKLIVSAGLFAEVCFRSRRESVQIQLPSASDVTWLALPGVVYTIDMVILYECVSRVSLTTYAVIRETRLIWAALIWTAVFGLPLSRTRWAGMGGIILGCCVNQIPTWLHDRSVGAGEGMWLSLLFAFLTGAAGVLNEYVLKKTRGLDINLQNVVHYFTGVCCILIYFAVFRPYVFDGAAVFFSGFGPPCIQIIILQVFLGLFVSRILKYMEAITEKVLGSFCSPVVVYAGAALFHKRLTVFQIVSPIIVFAACVMYLREGSLSNGTHVEKRSQLPPAK